MKKLFITAGLMSVLSISPIFGQTEIEMLQAFANAWRGKEEMDIQKPVTIGIQIQDGENYSLKVDTTGKATLTKGLNKPYYYHYIMKRTTLKDLYDRKYNALTAMGAARQGDYTPLDAGFADGAGPDEGFLPFFLSFSFHFWNREWPERILFGEPNARMVHGGLATVFYYQPGLRSAWYKLKAGMHANEKAADQKNTFPSFFIVTKGQGLAKLGGKQIQLREGEMYFIPANMTHEFWCEKTEMECVMIAFGEGA